MGTVFIVRSKEHTQRSYEGTENKLSGLLKGLDIEWSYWLFSLL